VQLVVPLHFEGIPEGVRLEGGFLDHVLREVEVECLPAEIPDFIEINVTDMEVGDSIHAADIQKEGVNIVTPGDRVIAAVHGKSVAAIAAEEEEAAAAAAALEGAEAAEGEAPAEGAEGASEGDKKSE